MQTTQTNLSATTVRANVNERAFFKSMRHLFSSSFSVMGEMVQNARRAQATHIAITCDSSTRVITISDNGMGIDKFDVLLDLATSGWQSTETQLSERPFGMGFFSSCYAADRVVVLSKGKRLEITQEDVIEQRTLQVHPMTSDELASMGEWVTRIELHGVNGDLLRNVELPRPAIEMFHQKLGVLVKGFPLPISFNGVDLPRECSQEALKDIGVHTAVGFVAVRNKLFAAGLKNNLQPPTRSNMRLYLHTRHAMAASLASKGVPTWTWVPGGSWAERRVPALPPRDDQAADEAKHRLQQISTCADADYQFGPSPRFST